MKYFPVVLAIMLMTADGMPASAYIQGGLVVHFDGIDDAGAGVHDSAATTWKDISGNGNPDCDTAIAVSPGVTNVITAVITPTAQRYYKNGILIYSDPLFMQDCFLAQGTPCVDAGVNLGRSVPVGTLTGIHGFSGSAWTWGVENVRLAWG
ncbi:MAG: hypothetical protein J6T01_04990 [Kiritimatiellae bacterium]|nr:hypothetical protein [Kiritimatiellia bacterium]